MSRNGCDQINLSAASRIAARVRSDFPILGTGCGLTRGRDDDCLISDTMLYYIDSVSVCKGTWDWAKAGTAPARGKSCVGMSPLRSSTAVVVCVVGCPRRTCIFH
jgi:hypothetical protein